MTILKAICTIVFLADTSLSKSLASLSSIDEPKMKAIKEESDDVEEISDEEMAHSYKVMYKSLVGIITENRGLFEQLSILK